ncbi:MAG: hypothetical protein Q7T20_08460 [Saprospiraceae bacterium]|nr:hypothetical protein [Saprospiraceae bacterium]
MKKQTGIWLDLRNAWVINLPVVHDGEIVVEHIASGIEENARIENTKMSTTWGPHGGNNQHTVEERRHHEEKHFFSKILTHIHPSTEELVIFGPSEAKIGLEKMLLGQHNTPNVMGVETADQMTEHQMKAWVRDYFGRPAARKLPKYGQEHQE